MSGAGAAGGPGLAQGAPASRWQALARAAARGAEPEQGDAAELQQLLAFELAGARYALPVERVREIVRMRPIAPVPRVSEDVRGVISLRGEILQVVDLRRRLSLPPSEPTRSSRIVVVHAAEDADAGDRGATGLLVDAVHEVLRVPEDAIRPADEGDPVAVNAICVRGDEFVSLIDLPRVLEIHGEP